MERIAITAGGFRERLAALAAKAAEHEAEHQRRLAGLPPGTCEACYGVGCNVCLERAVRCADGVPFEFRDARFANYIEELGNATALQVAREFLTTAEPRDLFLTGGVGAGKTRLACSVLNEQVDRRRAAMFMRVPMLLQQLQPGRDQEEAGRLERRLYTVELLALDDVGAERDSATDYTRRTIWMIYEARHDAGLRTIWTSNKSLGELSDMQGDDRLTSRIAGRADLVRLNMPDQRIALRRPGACP